MMNRFMNRTSTRTLDGTARRAECQLSHHTYSPISTASLAILMLIALVVIGCGPKPVPDNPPVALPAPNETTQAASLEEGAVAREAQAVDGREAPPPEGTLEPAPGADLPASGGTAPSPDLAAPATTAAGGAVPASDIAKPTTDASDGTRLLRLTAPGCCSQPFWSADSGKVLFVDRPTPDAKVGIWGVRIDRPESPPELIVDGVANYSSDLAYRIDVEDETTTILRRADGQRWTIPTGGRPVSIAPDRTHVAWQVSPPPEQVQRGATRVWVANIDGSAAHEAATLPVGSLSGWLSGGVLLVRGRDRLEAEEDVLWALSLADGTRREIVRSERIGGVVVSPGGKWIAYNVTRLPDPARSGLWLVPTAGGPPRRLDRSLFGAYRWRDGEHLLIVPLNVGVTSHTLVEVDAATLATRRLTNPEKTPFKIANGDWSVSPDGRHVVFVESRDKSIGMIELPDVHTVMGVAPR